jgi:uncharacterized protein (DUF305 family)
MMLHHQGAINTNWKALQKSQRPQIKDLVENLVAPQKKKNRANKAIAKRLVKQ